METLDNFSVSDSYEQNDNSVNRIRTIEDGNTFPETVWIKEKPQKKNSVHKDYCSEIGQMWISKFQRRELSLKDARNGDIHLKNPHIKELSTDVLYHLSLSRGIHDLKGMFGDVKFVCVGGTNKRMSDFAHFIARELNYKLPTGAGLYDISANSYRFSTYKVGPVLCISHGMGIPSMSIMLHEVIKLLHYSEVNDVIILRLGTCGGIGLEGGTLIVTNSVVDGLMRPYQEVTILGQKVKRPAIIDRILAEELYNLAKKDLPSYPVAIGTTMCTDDFYEGQARLDGAFCNYSSQEKLDYLERLRKSGIVNMEMECLVFAAMCGHAGISAGAICVSVLDRLQGDQVTTSKEIMDQWQLRPQKLAAMFIKQRLGLINPTVPDNSNYINNKNM